MIILYGAMYIIHRPLKIFIPMKDTLSAICILHKPLKIFIPMKYALGSICILHRPLHFPRERCSSYHSY